MVVSEEGWLKPVAREPAVRHVHRELRSAILRGRIPSGTRLVETHLAASLKVSRTPVREALHRLESEGLVRPRPNGGLIVEDAEARHLEAAIFRRAIESATARLACVVAKEADLRDLLAAAETALTIVPLMDHTTLAATDRTFHASLARAAHSPRAFKRVEEYYDYGWRGFWSGEPPARALDKRRQLFAQHVDIARALVERDADEAEAAVFRHLDSVQVLVDERTEAELVPA